MSISLVGRDAATDFGCPSQPRQPAAWRLLHRRQKALLHPSKALDAITLTSKHIWDFHELLPPKIFFAGAAAPFPLK